MAAIRRFFALFLVAALAFAPALAEARAGAWSSGSGSSSYSSMGSRGSRTYDPSTGAAPIQRSITPFGQSGSSASPIWGQPSYGYNSRPSFLRGVAAGLTGAWIASLLFGHSAYAYGGGMPMSGGGGLLGTILVLLLVFWGIRALFRGFGAGRQPYFASGAAGTYQPMPRAAQIPLPLADPDFRAFGTVLSGVQAAWSQGDLETMRRYVTPEMLSYFAETAANNSSRGVANRVENVQLIQGEPREAWREGGVDYATAYLRWSALDYTHRLGRRPGEPDFLVEGDPTRPVLSEELWTFRRVPGGRWLLSAIQQVA